MRFCWWQTRTWYGGSRGDAQTPRIYGLCGRGGNKAIALFKKEHRDIRCLITNLTMPDMDGWQTLAALRKIKPQLPAILSGGYNELRALKGEYAEHTQAFLHKPYMMDDLKNVLGQVLAETPEIVA